MTEDIYKIMFDLANDGIVILDENGLMLDVNQQFCLMYGYDKEALIGANICIVEPQGNRREQKERIRLMSAGESFVLETEHMTKSGGKIVVEVISKAIDISGKFYIQSFHRDISDRKRLQKQLYETQKLEAIGMLAGGIAHDFNNLLTGILGHSELLQTYGNIEKSTERQFRIIESSARKAGQIVSKLFSFARKGRFIAVPVNLSVIVRDACELLERSVEKKNINLIMDIGNINAFINGDGTQLEQVIMNLVMNSADAMPNGGTVTISTSLKNIRKNDSVIHPLLTPGNYVCMTVSDTGSGIPEEIRDKIFDPFFTTKGPERGTGLGLAIVYGIVREHMGVINIKTDIDKGTSFEIFFPIL